MIHTKIVATMGPATAGVDRFAVPPVQVGPSFEAVGVAGVGLTTSVVLPAAEAIHPVGRAPALQIDGSVIHESGAMVEYLCETRGPHLARAPGEEGRLGWLDWLHFAETIGQHIASLTQSHLMLRDPATRSLTVMKLETARLGRTLRLVEQTVAHQDWLMAGGFSGVDCAVGWSVWTAGRFVRLTPALQAYADRCTGRAAFQRALPQEGEPQLYERDFYELPDA